MVYSLIGCEDCGIICESEERLTHLIQKIEQLADVVCDGRRVWIAAFQVLFVDFAHAFHALVDAFIVAVGSCFWTSAWLNQQNCVRHV